MPDAQEKTRQPDRAPIPRRGGFVGDVARLASGTVVVQVLTVAAAPILSRLFTPADFGSAAVFMSLSGALVTVACLCYDLATVLPPTERDAASIFWVSGIAALTTSALFTLIAGLARTSIESGLHWQGMPAWPLLLGAAVLLGGVASALSFWHSRKRRFGRMSVARVGGSAVGVAAQMGAGFLGQATAAGLVHGTIAGSFVRTAALATQLGKEDRDELRRGFRFALMAKGAVRYRKFPLVSTWSALLNSLSWQLPALLLGYYFSSAVVGYYALGFRLLQLPMDLVGGAIAQVFFPRAVLATKEGNLGGVVTSVYLSLLDFGVLPLAVLGVVGPEVFSSVLGAQWNEAGIYAQILAPWTLVWFVSSPLHTLFSALEEQGLGLRMDALIFVTRFGSLAAGGLLGSPLLSVGLFSATGLIVYGYVALTIMNKAGVGRTQAASLMMRKIVTVLPFCAILLMLKLLGANSWVTVAVAGTMVLAYWAYLLRRFRSPREAATTTS